MDLDKCKRCGCVIADEDNQEVLVRIKLTDYNKSSVHVEKTSEVLCQYCTRALDNFLNCNWRFKDG